MNNEKPIELGFTLEQIITESYRSNTLIKEIYDIKFFSDLYLATCGSSIVFIYEVNKLNHSLIVKLSYNDQDSNENFYCLEYSECNNTSPLLLIAGKNGIIKGINCINYELEIILQGHGNSINDLKVHPVDDGLLLSASKDESIRLWNLRTSVCIAIFAGILGHRGEVLSIDIHLEGNCFVSAGMDSIKIWNLEDPDLSHTIDLSYTEPRRQNNLVFLTHSQQQPLYSTESLHRDYVDCVRFYGNFILSKSIKNRVVLWLPDRMRYKEAAVILREYTTTECGSWFTRFGICESLDIFALGNTEGKISIFSISGSASMLDIKPLTTSHYSITDDEGIEKRNERKKTSTTIKERFESNTIFRAQTVLHNDETKKKNKARQVAFDKSGQYLAYPNSDDLTINFWHIER